MIVNGCRAVKNPFIHYVAADVESITYLNNSEYYKDYFTVARIKISLLLCAIHRAL